MRDRWSDSEAAAFVARYGDAHGEDLALRTYSSRLLGCEPSLVLHGGGNTSVKGAIHDVFGDLVPALFVKASGYDLATIEPEGHVPVDLRFLQRLRSVDDLDDQAIENHLRTHLFDHRHPTPSIETPVHAFLPGRFIDHTHADAILALTNQPQGREHIREALGDEVLILPYVPPGFRLAREVALAVEARPEARAMVWLHHGIIVWGDDARESYARMIELVSRAERYIEARASRPRVSLPSASEDLVRGRLSRLAPLVRGRLARPTGDADRPHRRVILQALVSSEARALLDAPRGRPIAVSPPLTTDHLIRTRILPAWVGPLPWEADDETLGAELDRAIESYAREYRAYLERHAARLPQGVRPFDPAPTILLLPGLGALCAGPDASTAAIVRDILAQTLAAKERIAAMGAPYVAPAEEHLFDMEYRPLQHAKLAAKADPPLAGQVVLVTGAAGAIGAGISEVLLEAGAHLALTDLGGEPLEDLAEALRARYPGRILSVPLDVAEPTSVESGFVAVTCEWGGVDAVVINAGLAYVSSLEEMDLDRYRRLQRVNTDGTLLLLREASRHLKRQGTGGDVVLVSTKNVFAPGARFGAYSATKAAAHQLARIASQELAPYDVRVNMVAPDAVFSHRGRASGLWAEVGPDRMKARGLDPEGLEAYYRERNLLKAAVTAEHVGRAVLYFLTRPTPTTGATLPVDGGLPDATPR